MLNDRINKGICAPTEDTTTTIRDLKLFQDFLRRNFKDKYDKYEMRPAPHEPGKLYAAAKTHKFNSLDDIALDNFEVPSNNFTNRNIYIQCFKSNIEVSKTFM